MGTRLALWVTAVILVLSALAGAYWWVVVWRQAPPLDWRGWSFLAGVAVVQAGAWAAVLGLLLTVRRQPTLLLALATAVLGLMSLASHLLNGFTPALGLLISLPVLLLGLLGGIVVRRLTHMQSEGLIDEP